MEVVDASHMTRKDLLIRRLLERRGIVIYESNQRHSLEDLQSGAGVRNGPQCVDVLLSQSGEVYIVGRAGYYVQHTGRARWRLYQERDGTMSQGFVGVMLDVCSEKGDKVTDAQYIALAWLIRRLMTQHSIEVRNIVGAYQVCLPLGRARDPQSLDWRVLTYELINPSPYHALMAYEGDLP